MISLQFSDILVGGDKTVHLFLLPISTDDLSDAAFHACVLMNIVFPAITREVNTSSEMSPKRTRMKFQDDRVLLFMDGQREQVKAVTKHAEELHARKIDVFRGNSQCDDSRCSGTCCMRASPS